MQIYEIYYKRAVYFSLFIHIILIFNFNVSSMKFNWLKIRENSGNFCKFVLPKKIIKTPLCFLTTKL